MDKHTIAKAKHEEELAKRRLQDHHCAWAFLTGDEELHAEDCLFAARGMPTCSRTYFPGYEPDRNTYEGTGIGALFGFDDTDHLAAELAGWNVMRAGAIPNDPRGVREQAIVAA